MLLARLGVLFYLSDLFLVMKRQVVVFDFDGTLTQDDTMIQFICYYKGVLSLMIGLLLNFPWLLAYKLGIYPNWKAKQRLFAYFFKHNKYEEFRKIGVDFAKIIRIKKPQLLELQHFQNQGATIYVVSASIEEWVRPFCKELGVINVLATQIEVENGFITGNFLTKNCYGQEKVNRLLEVEPDRSSYELYAFGDSCGDSEMLAFADKGFKVK